MRPAIELISNCNHNCKFCPYRIDNRKIELGSMDWDVFTKLADYLAPQAEAIMLFNRGEPFLYPKIYEAIDYVGKKKHVIISTNGALIDAEKFYATAGDKTLVVSIQAGTKEAHEKITGAKTWEQVVKNTKELQEKKPDNVTMYVKLVKCRENEGHAELLKEWITVPIMEVDDSNQPNIHNYTDCTQPDEVPTWDFTGKRKVCCRDEYSKYDYEEYKEQARRRELLICKNCSIR